MGGLNIEEDVTLEYDQVSVNSRDLITIDLRSESHTSPPRKVKAVHRFCFPHRTESPRVGQGAEIYLHRFGSDTPTIEHHEGFVRGHVRLML